ncbi:MAG TPA: hypothetical protein VLK82_05135 [Candidatus Tectomicrobia bacterium]|nr:hypothetical protein [Candidatus Tectomicrobia bacterium]
MPRQMPRHRRYRCRFCGVVLPGWLPAAQAVDGAMLLGHLLQQHAGELVPYLARMDAGEDIPLVAAETYEVVVEQV